jgi:hypothetical protein
MKPKTPPAQLDLWRYSELTEEGRELPAWYPEARPKMFGDCQRLGLGVSVPCAFATCRHNLLADAYRVLHGGPRVDDTLGEDDDLWERETCSLAVAGRGRHRMLAVASMSALYVGTAENWQERAVATVMKRLGLEGGKPRPRHIEKGDDETGEWYMTAEELARKPKSASPPVRTLSREEIAREYAGRMTREKPARRHKD